jgi:hypothetical protein
MMIGAVDDTVFGRLGGDRVGVAWGFVSESGCSFRSIYVFFFFIVYYCVVVSSENPAFIAG